MGIACYSRMMKRIGRHEEAQKWNDRAHAMAANWLERARGERNTALTFDGNGWSMKYNLVWDLVLGLKLLPKEFYSAETESYLPLINEFGLPLDSRADYTKSDWTVWCASMAQDPAAFRQMIAPLAYYLRNTPTRVPFSDWYDTKTGRFVALHRPQRPGRRLYAAAAEISCFRRLQQITTACSNNQHAVLLFLVFAEIHPLPKGALAFTVAFIQVQVTVRTIKLVDFPHCLAKFSVNFLAGSFQKCAFGQNLSFFAMDNGEFSDAYNQYMEAHPSGYYKQGYSGPRGAYATRDENFYVYAKNMANVPIPFWEGKEKKAELQATREFWSGVLEELDAMAIDAKSSVEEIGNKLLEFDIAAGSYLSASESRLQEAWQPIFDDLYTVMTDGTDFSQLPQFMQDAAVQYYDAYIGGIDQQAELAEGDMMRMAWRSDRLCGADDGFPQSGCRLCRDDSSF